MGEGRLLLEQRTFDPAAGVAQSTQTLVEPDGSRESRTWSVRCYTATDSWRCWRAPGSPRCAVTATSRACRSMSQRGLVAVAISP